MFDQVLNAPLNRYSKIETKTLQFWAEGCTGYIQIIIKVNQNNIKLSYLQL